MRAGLILGTMPRHISKGGVGQAVGHLRFASAPDDTTLADNRDRKLDGWFFSAAPFFLCTPPLDRAGFTAFSVGLRGLPALA